MGKLKAMPFKIPSDLVAAIRAEARRLNVRQSTVLRYWVRLGMRTEPRIKSILP